MQCTTLKRNNETRERESDLKIKAGLITTQTKTKFRTAYRTNRRDMEKIKIEELGQILKNI